MELKMDISQKQIITQQMIQSMEILQMSTLELDNYLEKLSQENPVVELVETPIEKEPGIQEKLFRNLEWLSSGDRQNKAYYQQDGSDLDNESNLQDIRNRGVSLSEFLLPQVIGEKQPFRRVLEYIIYSLDANGYYHDDLSALAEHFHISEELASHFLAHIQSLDPPGVGARDLKECLILQLDRRGSSLPHTRWIIENHLEDIARQHLKKIADKMHISLEEVQACCEEIRSLNPRPGNSFNDREALRYVTPDAIVVQVDDHFEVLVNEYQHPRFIISNYYQRLAREVDDEDTRKYLVQKIKEARSAESGIRLRASTLSKVMEILVDKQYDFFLKGPGHKRPLKLADIAGQANLHESTVSRALRSKYLQCSWGVFALSYFLTHTAVAGEREDEDQTAEQIKQKLLQVVQQENKKKPLSDEGIRKELEKLDVHISRRTVNKYRQELGLPDKQGRKEW